jgi:hypothetical protein
MNENKLIINQVAGANIIEYELDLFESVPIPIVKSINDIENIAERKSDFSKTITLPGTQNNNDIFSNIFNLNRSVVNTNTYNFAPDFNPSLKADAILYKNGVVILQGYLQLVNINVVDDYEIEYEVIIIGRTANLFQDLGERKLNQLDLSAYNHTWNRANIEASWTGTSALGYYYGLIDYGIDSTEVNWTISNYYPQIYLKAIIDRIFSENGYSYSSNFFDSTRFKKLVIPTIGKTLKLSDIEVGVRQFLGERFPDMALTNFSSTSIEKMRFNVETYDTTPPNGYNTTTYEFTNRENGIYSFVSNLILDFKNNGGAPSNYNINAHIVVNGVRKNTINLLTQVINPSATVSVTKTIALLNYYLNVADVVYVEIETMFSNYVDLQWSLKDNSNFYNVANALITEGSTMELEKLLPDDIKQADLLSSVFKMFNLYVESDTLDDRKLIIEPRDDFYNSTLVDLTPNIDVSRGVKIEPLGALKYKEYLFQYDKDEDALNALFDKQYSYTYGSKRASIVNDFVTEDYKTEIIFAPTPLNKSANSNRVYTTIIYTDSSGNRIDKANKLRLLYNGGLIATSPNFTITESISGTVTSYSTFPYVGHLDNVANPTFDLSYGMPEQLFYDAAFYTNNNLFNIYHLKGLQEITNANSKLVTFFVKLSEVSINKLSFRNIYFIENQYYRLYELNYDSNSDEPAEITFLKLEVAPTFTGVTEPINGGIGDIATEPLPIYEQGLIRNGNKYDNYNDVLSYGNTNQIAGDSIINNSNGNIINGSKINVLGGKNNTAIHNNTTLINCDTYTTFREGQAVTNNIDQPLLATRVLTIAELSSLNTTPITILPKQDGFWTEIYDAYITVFFGSTSPKTGYNNHKLHLQYNGDGTHLLEFDNGITAKTTATKLRGVNVYDLPFKELAVEIHSQGNLGAAGNSEMLIELEYRLHPIIN